MSEMQLLTVAIHSVVIDARVLNGRLWDLDSGENYILVMSELDAYSEKELITSLAYNSTKGIW